MHCLSVQCLCILSDFIFFFGGGDHQNAKTKCKCPIVFFMFIFRINGSNVSQNNCFAKQIASTVCDLRIRHGETEEPEQWQQ